MKKFVSLVAALIIGATAAHATIQVLWQSVDGVLDPLGNPLPAGSLVQLLWSATDPSGSLGVNPSDITGNFGGAQVVWTSTTPFNVAIDGSSGLIPEGDLGVSEPTLLAGYVYVRVFSSAAPVIGDYFAITSIANPLGDMDPVSGGPVPTQVDLSDNLDGNPFSGIGTNPQLDWVQIVPEPSVLALAGLGALLVAVRRFRRS